MGMVRKMQLLQKVADKRDTDHSSNDPYAGLDRFGRVTDLRWWNTDSGSDLERVRYGYNKSNNRIWRQNPVVSTADELYNYNSSNQLALMQRGTLNAQHNGLVANTQNFRQQWTLDTLGNWTQYQESVPDNYGVLTLSLEQSRTHNTANEITNFSAGDYQPEWAIPTYDRAGNMISGPRPGDETTRHHYIYDAWNRLKAVKDDYFGSPGNTTIIEYQYDGRHFRIMRGARHFYYSSQGQVLEDRSTPYGPFWPSDRRYVWGLRYIDDLVCRDQACSTALDAPRLYAIQDANWNVTALTFGGNAGALIRTSYSAFGQPTIDSSVVSGSPQDIPYMFTGREYDNATGLYFYRARYYHPTLGRFTSRDPLGYDAEDFNLYRYVRNNPLKYVDPSGFDGVSHKLSGEYNVRLAYEVGTVAQRTRKALAYIDLKTLVQFFEDKSKRKCPCQNDRYKCQGEGEMKGTLRNAGIYLPEWTDYKSGTSNQQKLWDDFLARLTDPPD